MNTSPSLSGFERRALLTAGVISTVAACAVVFFFNPERFHFYPLCVFHQVTGLECPGCGGLRAAYQLMHGHLAAAWRYNALVTLLSPVAVWLAAREIIRETTGRALPGIVTRPVFAWILAATLMLFGVLRNLW